MSKESTSTSISLPLAEKPGKAIAKSRMSKRRFTVLLIVQLLIIAHVVQWLATGTTIAPIEPSEGMETVKYGIITAGFIFFMLALASTAILGRWFCGWGCHVVLLQDASAKLLNRFGIRPKPFRSRVLMMIPLILGLYMFVWPLAYRFIVAPLIGYDLTWPGFSTHLVTSDFWGTFPGWLVAIPFLFTCGFMTVYFLGMKGYCTYGCPYGGFFAPLDELSTGRIRVTDACEHCGHCTAVCTSNVRVHEEVRDFKMVVDPGCMKCMDCVSVCPNDALYYGFGKPAVKTDGRKSRKRRWDLSWGEEIAFAIIALLVFLSVRGAYSLISLLFASGVTAVVLFITFKAWQCLKSRDVRIHGWQLKRASRIRPIGGLFLAGSAVMLALVAHTGVVNGAIFLAEYHDGKVTTPAQVVFSTDPVIPEEEIIEHARKSRQFYEFGSWVGDGGIGLAWALQPAIDNRISWLLAVENRRDEARERMVMSIDRFGLSPEKAAGLARLMRAESRDAEAADWYRRGIEENPESFDLVEEYVHFLESDVRPWEAITYLKERLAEEPTPTEAWLESTTTDEVMTRQMRSLIARKPQVLGMARRLSLLLINNAETPGELADGVRLIERTLDIEPENPFAYRALALGYVKQERWEDAVGALVTSVRLEPDEPLLRQQLADLLASLGRVKESQEVLDGKLP